MEVQRLPRPVKLAITSTFVSWVALSVATRILKNSYKPFRVERLALSLLAGTVTLRYARDGRIPLPGQPLLPPQRPVDRREPQKPPVAPQPAFYEVARADIELDTLSRTAALTIPADQLPRVLEALDGTDAIDAQLITVNGEEIDLDTLLALEAKVPHSHALVIPKATIKAPAISYDELRSCTIPEACTRLDLRAVTGLDHSVRNLYSDKELVLPELLDELDIFEVRYTPVGGGIIQSRPAEMQDKPALRIPAAALHMLPEDLGADVRCLYIAVGLSGEISAERLGHLQTFLERCPNCEWVRLEGVTQFPKDYTQKHYQQIHDMRCLDMPVATFLELARKLNLDQLPVWAPELRLELDRLDDCPPLDNIQLPVEICLPAFDERAIDLCQAHPHLSFTYTSKAPVELTITTDNTALLELTPRFCPRELHLTLTGRLDSLLGVNLERVTRLDLTKCDMPQEMKGELMVLEGVQILLSPDFKAQPYNPGQPVSSPSLIARFGLDPACYSGPPEAAALFLIPALRRGEPIEFPPTMRTLDVGTLSCILNTPDWEEKLGTHENIDTINLDDSLITDTQLHSLLNHFDGTQFIPRFPNLNTLRLRRCPNLTNTCVQRIVDDQIESLRYLDLTGCYQIAATPFLPQGGDAQLKERLRTLQELRLDRTAVTAEQRQMIAHNIFDDMNTPRMPKEAQSEISVTTEALLAPLPIEEPKTYVKAIDLHNRVQGGTARDTDASIVVGSDRLPIHKQALALRTNVGFEGEELTGIADRALAEALIQYVYIDELPNLTLDQLKAFTEFLGRVIRPDPSRARCLDATAAEKLRQRCIDMMITRITPDRAGEMLAWAQTHGMVTLESHCRMVFEAFKPDQGALLPPYLPLDPHYADHRIASELDDGIYSDGVLVHTRYLVNRSAYFYEVFNPGSKFYGGREHAIYRSSEGAIRALVHYLEAPPLVPSPDLLPESPIDRAALGRLAAFHVLPQLTDLLEANGGGPIIPPDPNPLQPPPGQLVEPDILAAIQALED